MNVNVPDQMREYSGLLETALRDLRAQSAEYAAAEKAYRKAKAVAWLQAPKGTVPERKAWVDDRTADECYRRDMADGLRQSALEEVRSRRGQISALQTAMNADREEAAFARTGPEGLVA